MARRLGRLFTPVEMAYPDYLYEFAPASGAS
jgi:hypothetical protein